MSELRQLLQEIDNEFKEKIKQRKSSASSFDTKKLTQSIKGKLPEAFEVGEFSRNRKKIPAFIPFKNTNGIVFSIKETSSFPIFNELIEKSVFQILSALQPSSFKLTLIDGKNHGINLDYLARLDKEVNKGKVYKTKDEIIRILNEILIESHSKNHFIIINNFPHNFDSESGSLLYKILRDNQGNNSKLKIILTKELKPSKSIADLDNSISSMLENIKILDGSNQNWSYKVLESIDKQFKKQFKLYFKSSFGDSKIKQVISSVNQYYKNNKSANQEKFEVDDGIKIPIGKEKNSTFYFKLGHDTSNYHGIIAGRSGKGKTVLLDNIIAKGIEQFTPDELRYILVDLKGIEFGEYKKAPHVQAFCSSSKVDDAIKVIDFIRDELKRREQVFNTVEASSIVDYKRKANKVMPRLLVIIDEFQNFFTGNFKQDNYVENILIKQILRIGRAYGVHLLCCTQSLGDGVRSSFLNNIPLRISFQMTQDQSRSFLALNNPKASNLKVGEIIYNEQDGLAAENQFVKVNHIKSIDVENIIHKVSNNQEHYEDFTKKIVSK